MSAQQNLVPNGSFEEYTVCPNNQGQVTGYLKNWFDPTFSSSDYFNTCSINNITGLPSNIYGYKNPKTGNGITGFVTYQSSLSNYREYVCIKLNEKLERNKSYCISFYISLSGSSKFASNNIGFLLVADTIGLYNYFYSNINIPPTRSDTLIYSDTTKWNKVEFIYKNYNNSSEFLIIGTFNSDANLKTKVINPNGFEGAYYYLDDVEFILCDTLEFIIPNVISSNNDGVNDTFKIKNIPSNTSLNIFNRWGSRVYYSENYQNDWRPDEITAGTYYYIIQTETETYKGFIQLIR